MNEIADLVTFVDELSLNDLDKYLMIALGARTEEKEGVTVCYVKDVPVMLSGEPKKSPFYHSFSREWELCKELIELFRVKIEFKNGAWYATFRNSECNSEEVTVAVCKVLLLESLTKTETLFRAESAEEFVKIIFE